jgi:hypothetical protein
MVLAPWSSEREHVGLDPGVEELDLEQPVADRRRLADQLVRALIVGGAVAGLVDVDAMGVPGWFAVEVDREATWSPRRTAVARPRPGTRCDHEARPAPVNAAI